MYRKIKYCAFILVFFSCYFNLLGQSSYQEIPFSYKSNNEIFIGFIEISMEENFIQEKKNNVLKLNDKEELDIDFSQVEEGGVSIKFRNLKWDENKNRHQKNKLIVPRKQFEQLLGLELLRISEDIVLETGLNNKIVRFNAVKSVTDQIEFRFYVENHKGERQIAQNIQANSDIVFKQYYSIVLEKKEVENQTEQTEEVEANIKINEELIEEKEEEPISVKSPQPKKDTKKMSDAEHWKYALQQNTVEELSKYANRDNASKWKFAQNKIDTLKWQKAKRSNNIKAYKHYLDKDAPSGAFRQEAKSKIDDKLWGKATSQKTLNAYQQYLTISKKHQQVYKAYKPKYENQAQQKFFEIDVEIKRNGNDFVVTLENAELPIFQKNIQTSQREAIKNLSIRDNQLDIGLKDNQKVEIELQDALGKQAKFSLDNTIQALKAELKTDNQALMFFNVAGGKAPYYVQLKKDGEEFKHSFPLGNPTGEGQYLELKKEALTEKGLQGNYTVYFTDERKAESKTFQNIEIQRPPRNNLVLFLLGGLSLLALILWLFDKQKQQKKRSKKAEEIEGKLKEREKKQKAVIIKKKEETKVNGASSSKLNGVNGKNLNINKEKYFKIELDKIWKNTAVNELFLHKKCIQALDNFVREQNKKTMLEEVDTPEIGGFLLGNYDYQNKKNQYQVALEKFVPITPGEQGVYKIEFGSKAWAELAAVQEKNEDLEVIGWFHTHPGHGLFLSKPDMRIQNGFFREKYQLAMEIDPLTENMDTTFFSRNQDGKMNNKDDIQKNAKWLKWVDIDKWTRKK